MRSGRVMKSVTNHEANLCGGGLMTVYLGKAGKRASKTLPPKQRPSRHRATNPEDLEILDTRFREDDEKRLKQDYWFRDGKKYFHGTRKRILKVKARTKNLQISGRS
jgi:transposase